MEIFKDLKIGSLTGDAAAAVIGAIAVAALVILIVVLVSAIRAIKERNEVEDDARANRYYANYARANQNTVPRRSETASRQSLPVVPYMNPANSRPGAQSTNADVYLPSAAEDNEIVTLPPDPTMGMGMYPGMYPPPMMGGYMPPMPPMMPYNPYMGYPMQQPEEIYHLPEMLERDEVYSLPEFVDPLAAATESVERPDRSDDIKSILEAMKQTEEAQKAEEVAAAAEEEQEEPVEEKVEEVAHVRIAQTLPEDEEIVTLEDAHGNRAEYIRVSTKPDRTDDISILMHAGDIPMREVVQEVKEEVSVAPAAEEETAPVEQHVVDNSERPDRKDDIFVLMHMNDHAEEQVKAKEEAPAFAASELADNLDDDEIVELEFAEEPVAKEVAKEVKEEPVVEVVEEEKVEEQQAEAAEEEEPAKAKYYEDGEPRPDRDDDIFMLMGLNGKQDEEEQVEEKAEEQTPAVEEPAQEEAHEEAKEEAVAEAASEETEEAKEEKEEESVAKYYEDNAPRPDRNDDIFLLMGLSGKHEDEKEEAAKTAAEEAPAEQPVAASAAEEEHEAVHDEVHEKSNESSDEDNDETNNNNKKTAVVLAALGGGGGHDSEERAEEAVADDDEEIVELEEYVPADVEEEVVAEEEESAKAKYYEDGEPRPDRNDDITMLMHANDKVEEPVAEEEPVLEEVEEEPAKEEECPDRTEDISMLMQPETEDEENKVVELEDLDEELEEPAAEAAEEPEEEQTEEPVEEPEEEPAEEPEQEPTEEEPAEEPEEQPEEEPAKPEGVLLKKEEDWSNYDGDFDGYYYDPNDGCYYEGEPSDELKEKIEAKKRAYEEANDNTRKKVSVKKVKPLFMPLSTPKHDRKSPEKSQRAFDDSSIYGKYVIEHATTDEGGKEYFFTLYDPNDESLYESDNFTSLENCKKAINRFKVHVQSGTLTVAAEDGKYLYQLVTSHFTYKGLPKPNFEDADATIEQVLDYYATPIVREQ